MNKTKRLFFAIILLLLAPSLCLAQSVIGSGVIGDGGKPITHSGGGGGGYTGPGDQVSGALVWYGMRAYSSAIAAAATQKLIKIINIATSETCDVIVATNGGFGNVANCSGSSNGLTPTAFCALSSSSCNIVTWYDQSGHGVDVTQATANERASLLISCLNSLPCANFQNGQTDFYTSATNIGTSAQPFTMTSVAIRNNSFSTEQDTIAVTSTPVVLGFSSTTGLGDIYGGSTATFTASNSAWHVIQGIFNGASSIANVDNTQTTGLSAGTNTVTANPVIFGQNNFSNFFLGEMVEGGIWGGGFTTGQQTNMCHNAFTYWATSTSC
jgi:hypothetical protein